MKTADYVKAEISKIRLDHQDYSLTKSILDKARGKIVFLERCYKYLTSECDKESYLQRDLYRLNKKIEVINKSENYSNWRTANPDKARKFINPENGYKSDVGLNKIKKQIATLEYLIS